MEFYDIFVQKETITRLLTTASFYMGVYSTFGNFASAFAISSSDGI